MPAITMERARSGRYAMKAYLNKKTSSTPYRTMILSTWNTTADPNNRTSPHAPFFQDSWVGFSIYLPSTGAGNWAKPSGVYEVLVQWHDSHDPFPPPVWDQEESKNPLFSIAVSDTPHPPARHWSLGYLGESRTPYPTLGSPRPWKYESGQTVDLGPIDPDLDKWTDWVVRIRWNFWKVGTSNNFANWQAGVYDNVAGSPNCGLIQVWKNGKLVFEKNPVQIGANDNGSPFFSAGLYKGWREQAQRDSDADVTDRLMYFDEFRYGNGNAVYSDVAPGGARSVTPAKGTPVPTPPSSVVVR
jgi:Polysaccharide lyase